ncbi:MAG: hypothetical protein L0Y57_01790 [Beijerinckiaceae bacterium]|nr:hypothetical protein [Beijerinckiaceae bacterium]
MPRSYWARGAAHQWDDLEKRELNLRNSLMRIVVPWRGKTGDRRHGPAVQCFAKILFGSSARGCAEQYLGERDWRG